MLSASLVKHDFIIKSVDWAPKSNRIVTCSADRNAYVWSLEKDRWIPILVHLRIERGAVFVKWSPEENKFAVGSNSKAVSICHYDKENNWWSAKHILKPIRSTVTSLDWHPNNTLLACGSTDRRVRVFSSAHKDYDQKPVETPWGKEKKFGDILADVKNSVNGGGWIHSVCFSGDGNKLSWVAHDSSINVIEATNPENVIKFKTKFTPFLSVIWTSPVCLIAAGHDYIPIVFTYQNGKIKQTGKFKGAAKEENKKMSAMNRFQQMVDKGSVGSIIIDSGKI